MILVQKHILRSSQSNFSLIPQCHNHWSSSSRSQTNLFVLGLPSTPLILVSLILIIPNLQSTFFLIGTGSLTTLQLFLYTLITRRLNLSTVAFLQYLTPSCKIIIGIFLNHETLLDSRFFTFVLFWIALMFFLFRSSAFFQRYHAERGDISELYPSTCCRESVTIL
jgi:hypothetical protein